VQYSKHLAVTRWCLRPTDGSLDPLEWWWCGAPQMRSAHQLGLSRPRLSSGPSNSPGRHPMDVRLQQVVAGPLIITLHLVAPPVTMALQKQPLVRPRSGRRMGGSWQLRLCAGLHHLLSRLSRPVLR
jgi:hypothetical protein